MKSQSEISLTPQKYGNKTFEFVSAPPLVADSGVTLAYGIELEGRFTELPVFAGGTHDRSFVQLNLAIDSEFADRVSELETSVRSKSAFRGDWTSSVANKSGISSGSAAEQSYVLKVRLDVTSATPTNFRVGSAPLARGWPALREMLDAHGNLRGADVKVVLRPQKVWEVQGKVGITWKLLQIDFEPRESSVHDYFAQ